jgi:DNA-3-methyladenine glycosylase I
MLVLEGAQAGLSWLTVLRKRANYRKAFDNFEIETVARYAQQDMARLLADPGIVRNRLKIEAAVRNALGVLSIQEEFGSFDAFLWRHVDGIPQQKAWDLPSEVPAKTAQSDALSRELKKRGFNFVGATICYAFMQAVGMVNDHLVDCFRHTEIRTLAD